MGTFLLTAGIQNTHATGFVFRAPVSDDPVVGAQSAQTAPLTMTAPVIQEMQTRYRPISIMRQASVEGGMAPFLWRLDGAPSWVHIDQTTGQLYGSVEDRGAFVFEIVVTDAEGTEVIEDVIIDADEPMAVYNPIVDETYVGDEVNVILEASVEGGRGPFQWSLLSSPAWLNIDPNSGYLHGIAGEDDVGNNAFIMEVVDYHGRTEELRYGFEVRGTIEISGLSVKTALTGLDVVFDGQPTGTGGKKPYQWSLNSGAPSWLSINQDTGVLAGLPTDEGDFPFTIEIADANGVTGSADYVLNVVDMNPEEPHYAYFGEIETRDYINEGIAWGNDVSITNDGEKVLVYHQEYFGAEMFDLSGSAPAEHWTSYLRINGEDVRPVTMKMSADGTRYGGAFRRGTDGQAQNAARMEQVRPDGGYSWLPYIVPADMFEPDRQWGRQYAISGNGDTFAVASETGWVYIMDFDGTTWVNTDRIRPPSMATISDFGKQMEFSDDGNRLAISGTRTIRGEKRNIVYVVEKTNGDWPAYPSTFENAFWAWNDLQNRPFAATDMAFSGDGERIAITSRFSVDGKERSGSIHVFDRTIVSGITTWYWSASIETENVSRDADFGMSVDINYDGTTIAVGAPLDRQGQGSGFVFEFQDDEWYERQKLTSSEVGENGRMGMLTTISGDGQTVLFQAPGDRLGTLQVFKR